MSATAAAVGGAHGPTDADSQSTLDAPPTRHTPRSLPVVSNANNHGSLPESLIVNHTPGWVWLSAAAEFSTNSGRASSGTAAKLAGGTPIESVLM